MIYFTSDTHFGHTNIIKYCEPTRGHFRSAFDMDEALIANYNFEVRQEDTVYHLGDFAFAPKGRVIEILSRLNGSIYILKGNHDKILKKAFCEELKAMGLVKDFIPACSQVKYEKTIFILNHYGMRVWDRSHYGTIHLYGHSHGTLPSWGRSMDVGVDPCNLTPISAVEIIERMSTIPAQFPDHHSEKTK